MIFPVLMVSVVMALYTIHDRKKTVSKPIFLIVICAVLALIAAFRSPLTADYDNYEYFYYSGTERFEIGFQMLAEFCKLLKLNLISFFLVCAALSVSIKVFAIKKMSTCIAASVLVYVSNLFILHDMIQIRCAIASGMILLSMYYLVEKKLPQFLCIVIFATLFHNTAIVVLPLWFLNNDTKFIKYYLWLIPVAYVLYFTGIRLAHYVQLIPLEPIQALWLYYDDFMNRGIGHNDVNVLNVVQIIRCGVCMFLLHKSDVLKEKNKYALMCAKVYTIALFIYVTFSDMPTAADRLSEFLSIVEVILLPCLLFAFNKRGSGLIVLLFIAVVRLYVHIILTNHLL